MSKRKKKVSRLSDGRMPWEPKTSTIEQRHKVKETVSETYTHNVSDICQELFYILGRGMFINEQGKTPGWILLENISNSIYQTVVGEYDPLKQYCVCDVVGSIIIVVALPIDDSHTKLRVISSLKSTKELAQQIAHYNEHRLTEFLLETLALAEGD